jgi:hypothetical protein
VLILTMGTCRLFSVHVSYLLTPSSISQCWFVPVFFAMLSLKLRTSVHTNCKNKNLFMLLQVLKHLIYFCADDVLEAEGNFHQPFHMILMIMGNGRVTFQAEAAMPSAQNLVLLSQVRTPRHNNLYITVVNGKRCWFFCFIPGRTSPFSVHPYA